MVALWHTSKKKAVASIRHSDQKAIGGEDPASDCRNWVRRPAQTQLAPGAFDRSGGLPGAAPLAHTRARRRPSAGSRGRLCERAAGAPNKTAEVAAAHVDDEMSGD